MKNLIGILTVIAIVLISLTSFGKTNEKTILVQAQGKVIRLNTGDISYLKSVCHNAPMVKALNSLTVIKNVDSADLIMSIMKSKK